MDNCSVHMRESTLKDHTAHRSKVVSFPPHTTNIFQCLDLSRLVFSKRKSTTSLRLIAMIRRQYSLSAFFTTRNRPWSKIMCIVHLSKLESGIISTSFPVASYSMNLHFAKVRSSSHFGDTTILWSSRRLDGGMHELVGSTKHV
jgi:hypothetical protein